METGMWVPKFETLPELLHYRSARVSQEGVASHQHIMHRTFPLIFPVIIQTINTAQMLSTGGKLTWHLFYCQHWQGS